MKILLERDTFTANSTTGKLSIDGKFQCYVLEDVDRKLEAGGTKIKGETCIPRGTYPVQITYSPKYGKPMPAVLNVPQYEGIRIHPGNAKGDTEGCLLPGTTRSTDFVGGSKLAFEELFAKIKAAQDRGEKITIQIV